MQSTLNQNETDATWKQIAPVLDDAMGALGETDRNAVLLRYFESKPLAEVGLALGVSEDAARVRVNRALEKLRTLMTRKGVTLGATAIAGAVTAKAVTVAPNHLLPKIVATTGSVITASVGSVTFLSTILGKTLVVGSSLAILFIGVLAGVREAGKTTSPKPTHSTETHIAGTVVQPTIGNGSVTNIVSEPRDNIDLASEHLRLVLHTAPATHSMYGSAAITNAIDEFGLNRKAAFNVLLENSSDPEEFVRAGSIYGMGHVGKNLSEVAPVLWNMLGTASSRERWHIFQALEQIGFGYWDMPALTDLLADDGKLNGNILAKLVPEAIADVLEKNPQSSMPYIAPLEALLTGQNSNTQVRAALALVKFEGTNNQNIYPPLHELFARPSDRASEYFKDLAAGILQNAGPAAKPLVPDMLEFADYATETGAQSAARTAVAMIDPEAGKTDPQIAASVKQLEDDEKWKQIWQSKNYTLDDLREALKDEHQAYKAAGFLAAMGTNALVAVPDMVHAMWWQDEDTRNSILDDIKKIDPKFFVSKIPTTTFITGNLHDYDKKLPLTQQDKELKGAVTSFELFYGWVLPDEFAAFTNKICGLNPEAYKTFIDINADKLK